MEQQDVLFPYQLAGAQYLSQSRFALLADEMGLGKTGQAIRACDLRGCERILVLCPAIARINWLREFDRWSLYGLPSRALFSRSDAPSDAPGITVCSYDLLPEHAGWLGKNRWDVLICDEAHYLKSVDAGRSRFVLGKGGLVHAAKARWFLSGTPMPNHVGELWPLLFVSGVTPLRYDDFLERYAKLRRTQWGVQITGTKNTGELRGLLSKIMLRRTKAEVMKQLPSIHYGSVVLEPGPVDLEVHMFDLWRRAGGDDKLKAVVDRQEAALQAMIDTLKTGSTPMRDLLPIMQGAQKTMAELRQYTGLAKVAPVVETIAAELASGTVDKIVLFAVHKSVIETLREGLRKFKPLTLYGGTPPNKRQEHLDKFQKDPRYRVFIANIAAAGTAVTLTAARHVGFVECDWTNANNAQAAMRVHRIGQERTVYCRFFALANSTDERVNEVLRRKIRDELSIFGE